MHDWLREDLTRIREAAVTGSVRGRVGRPLAVHCAAFCSALTRHHTGEDAGAFPALAAAFPELRAVLAKLEEDHVLIAGIIARVEEIARVVGEGSGTAELVGELDGLAAILESHFSFEERRIVRALDDLAGAPAEMLGVDPPRI